MKRKIIGAMAALSIGAALFAGEKTVDFARVNDPSAWDRNVPGKLNIAYDSEARGMKFTPVFRDEVKDFWVYPGIPLNLPAESMKNAVELRFEVKAVPAKNVKFMLVIPVFVNAEGKRKSVHLNVDAPTEQWEERSVSLLRGDLNPEPIRTSPHRPECEGPEYHLLDPQRPHRLRGLTAGANGSVSGCFRFFRRFAYPSIRHFFLK